MNGKQLFKKLRKFSRKKGFEMKLVKSHGKGSHGTLYFGARKTTIKDLKKEIGPGLLKAMLDNLGLTKEDIE